MRKVPLLLILLFAAAGLIPCQASVSPSNAIPPAEPGQAYFKADLIRLLKKITPEKYKLITGRKMTWKERIGLRILQWRSKWLPRSSEPTERQLKQGRLSLIFGAVGLGIIFIPYAAIASLPLAVAGLVLGIKSLKGNSNTNAILGVVFSGVVLFLFILAIIFLSIFLLAWE